MRILTAYVIELWTDAEDGAVSDTEIQEFDDEFLSALTEAIPGLLEEVPSPIEIVHITGAKG